MTVRLPSELPTGWSNRLLANEWRRVSRQSSELCPPAGAHQRAWHEQMYEMEEQCTNNYRRRICTNELDLGETTVRNLTGMD